MSVFRGAGRGRGDDSVPPVFRGGFTMPIGRIITIVIVLVVACGVLFLSSQAIQRVDPGFTAIVVDYSVGQQVGQQLYHQVPTGSFFIVNPLTQRVAKYPLAQQTLSMVRRSNEGQVVGDDSVECNDITGVRVNIDSSTLWRVIPDKAGNLYFLRPDVPLGGD